MKTTKKDFEIFKSECEKWIDFFGLKEWNVFYKQTELEEPSIVADCYPTYIDKSALIRLNTEIQDNYGVDVINRFAFHEICHLLLNDIRTIGESRFVTPGEFDNKEHEIIHKLTNSVFRNIS